MNKLHRLSGKSRVHGEPRRRFPRALLSLCLLVGLAIAVHLAQAAFAVGRGTWFEPFAVHWMFNIGLMAASGIPLVHMLREPRHRLIHGLFFAAILAWALGNIYWSVALRNDSSPPYPSLADAGWLAFYPPAYAALLLVIRARVRRFLSSIWLDGAIAITAAGAFATAFVLHPILAGIGGTTAEIATNLAYPLCDVVLFLLVLLAVAVNGWRFDRQFGLLAAGLVMFTLADSIYLYRIAAGTYTAGTFLDSLWLIGIALMAFAFITPFRSRSAGRYEGWMVTLAPIVFALAALGLLVYGAIVPVPVEVPILAMSALILTFIRVALTFRDVRSLADARRLATTDELTGLPNRRWFIAELARRTLAGEPTSLLIADLSHFKEINDTLGHPVGDRVLEQVGTRMETAAAQRGRVARLGGDEFAALCDTSASAATCARLIHDDFARGFEVDGLTLSVGAGIGIAESPRDASDASTLMRCADIALYESKREQTPYTLYNVDHDHFSVDNLLLTSDLRAAIADQALTLVYQPKVALPSGRLIGVEALARWEHPDRGNIPPIEFIQLAEAAGLMQHLTRTVLAIAARQMREWLDHGRELEVAVNISVTDLIDESFPSSVESVLYEHGVPARLLQLEITETELMSDSTRTMAAIERLTRQGIRIALDDFGTGYSSLQYLQCLRLHELKIDRAFVTHMAEQESDAAIVRCAIEMAKAFRMTVVAEGVESRDAVNMLADLGCDAAQGYDISRPLPAWQLEMWLDDRDAVATGVSARFAGAR